VTKKKNENIKGDVETMEPNEGRDRELVEKKGAGVLHIKIIET
jgi:hypothetical protein